MSLLAGCGKNDNTYGETEDGSDYTIEQSDNSENSDNTEQSGDTERDETTENTQKKAR